MSTYQAQVVVAEVEPSRPSASSRVGDFLKTALVWLGVAFVAFLAVYRLNPPDAVNEAAPAMQFSAGRAMRHLGVIAQTPRSVGSPGHDQARAYILEQLRGLGFDAQQQDGAVVSNLMARLAGTAGGGKAVVLVGHYDTVPRSPGAADDGYAVATLLETARALKAGPPLKHDVIFLFTDGEERGLLGAKAFVHGHPWGREAGLVLNFDARGDAGPFLMFQTSDPDGWLVEEFGKAAPSPVANSMMSDIYRMLPNDTDFTVFRDAGVAGLNFACIDGFHAYHTQGDDLQHSDGRTLQHAGSQALALARHFGDADVNLNGEGRAVYFDVLRAVLVRYSQGWALPLAVVAALLFAAVVAYGLVKRQLTLSGVAQGLLALPLSIAGAAVLVAAAQSLGANGSETAARGYAYRDLYLLGLLALTLAATSGVYVWFRRGVGAQDLTAGTLLWWLILTTLTTLFLPGGSYLFTWPLLFGLVALGLSLVMKSQLPTSSARQLLFSACAIPAVVLVFPMAYLMLVGLALQWAAVIMALVVLALALIVPHLCGAASRRNWWFPAGSAVAGLMLIAVVHLGS